MKLNMQASEIMTRNVVSVNPNQKLSDLKELFTSGKFHYNIPVIENDRLIGMVVLTDFMFAIKSEPEMRESKDYGNLKIKDIMREKVLTISPTTTVREIARAFADGEVHTFMIVDNGQLQGIVSTADIIRHLMQE